MSNLNKVLVVEDDIILREIITRQLSARYQVVTAGDGEEALQKIKSERPGVIVLDLILPKLDGFAVLQNLQNLPDALARTPVVILSNLPDSKNLSQDPNFNVEAYYTKSGTALDTVIDKVDRIFAEQAV
ncbi:MAG: response regulator [Patescibacteria group bacterium]|nr:response regulator [Patescibacteria group bacterium]